MDLGGGGGGISEELAALPNLLARAEEASSCVLSRAVVREEPVREGAGVTDAPLLSPIVMRINSLIIPSSP